LIPPAPELLGSFRLRRADCKKGCNDGRKYPVSSRREFLVRTASFTAGVRAVPGAVGSARTAPVLRATETATLSGAWLFRTDSHDRGTNENWFTTDPLAADWRKIDVPHTWQVEPSLAAYRGIAWYCRGFDAPGRWAGSAVRIEFCSRRTFSASINSLNSATLTVLSMILDNRFIENAGKDSITQPQHRILHEF